MSTEESHEHAAWENRISMEGSHAHIRESVESLSASSLILLLQVLRELCESLCFIANSVLFHRSGCTPFSIANRDP